MPLTAEELLQVRNERFVSEATAFEGAYEYLGETPGADGQGWTLSSVLPVIVPREMAGSAFSDSKDISGGFMKDGNCATMVNMQYVDDAAFDDYVRSLGEDPAVYHDKDHPRVVGISKAYGNDGSSYQLLTTLQNTGNVEAIGGEVYMNRYPALLGAREVVTTSGRDSADAQVWDFVPSIPRADDEVYQKELTMKDVEYVGIDLEVAKLADEPPAVVGGNGSSIMFVAPMSLAYVQGFGMEAPYFEAQFNAIDGDHEQLADDLSSRGGAYFHDEAPYEMAFYTYNDRIEELSTTQMLATIVNVFCLLFTVILALIAMANVFNLSLIHI